MTWGAVVASAVGGIQEVVVHGETGYLVCLEQMTESPFEALHPEKFSRDLAGRVNDLMADPAKRRAFGAAGRKRVESGKRHGLVGHFLGVSGHHPDKAAREPAA